MCLWVEAYVHLQRKCADVPIWAWSGPLGLQIGFFLDELKSPQSEKRLSPRTWLLFFVGNRWEAIRRFRLKIRTVEFAYATSVSCMMWKAYCVQEPHKNEPLCNNGKRFLAQWDKWEAQILSSLFCTEKQLPYIINDLVKTWCVCLHILWLMLLTLIAKQKHEGRSSWPWTPLVRCLWLCQFGLF